jgi:hypothetical protein
MLTYALGVGLGSMLTIGAAADQVRTDPVATGHVTQYCAPPHDYPDAHRFYCRREDDWPCPTGAAAFSCFMQEIEEMMRSWSLRLTDGGAGCSPTGAGSPIWRFDKTFWNGAKDSGQGRVFSCESFGHPRSSQCRGSALMQIAQTTLQDSQHEEK